jgi:hypothetical protein
MAQKIDWKTRVLIIGALVGAITGVAASYIMVQQAEKQQKQMQVTPGDGVKLGLGVLTLLRLVSDISNRA